MISKFYIFHQISQYLLFKESHPPGRFSCIFSYLGRGRKREEEGGRGKKREEEKALMKIMVTDVST